MEHGAFSIGPAVKDMEASRAFCEKLGFKPFAGEALQHWLILNNGPQAIDLFQGMFSRHIRKKHSDLPSRLGRQCQQAQYFPDVRDLQRKLQAQGVQLTTEADDRSRRDLRGAGEFYGNRPRRKPDSGRSARRNLRGDSL